MTSRDEDAGELLTVGQVAARYGVTVRTLHHYDEIGLLRPSERSFAGYRLYAPADLDRLRDIVVYRRLDFPLDEIATVLASPGEAAAHLIRQRALVMTRVDELRQLVSAIDRALEKHMTNEKMSAQDLRDLFGGEFSDEYAEQAREEWGESPQWAQSAERTSRYGRADWQTIKKETDELLHAFAAAAEAGPADAPGAMDLAERHREHIARWFYDLDHAFHEQLGEMTASDARYAAQYDTVRPGLAAFVRDAIRANAARR